MKAKFFREITPLNQFDCFTIFKRKKNIFDFPLHTHEEFELNFILNGKGVKRIIGDHSEEIEPIELVLVGSNLPHGWFANHLDTVAEEVTIQFHKDLFDQKFLKRNQLYFIRTLLEKSANGILFSKETAQGIQDRILNLVDKQGFESILELLSILHSLSISEQMRLLSSSSFEENNISYNSRRIEVTFEFIRTNFLTDISLAEVAKLANMTEVSFSRFFKKHTGKTFIDSLNEVRLGHATRLLIDTTQTIAEIAFQCGFNNLSHFNRLFKQKKACTPKEFRDKFAGKRTFI
ncbi:MAG: AraC family transcriptional regulator [Spirosomataceae bacterium]